MSSVTMQELEAETAELLPARETLCHYSCGRGSSNNYFQSGNGNYDGNGNGNGGGFFSPSILSGNLNGNLNGLTIF
jgi:hypothetical protein